MPPESVILSKDEGANATEAASKDPEDINAINGVSRCSHKTAWGELPDAAWQIDTLSGSFDMPSSREAGLVLAQDDSPKQFQHHEGKDLGKY